MSNNVERITILHERQYGQTCDVLDAIFAFDTFDEGGVAQRLVAQLLYLA